MSKIEEVARALADLHGNRDSWRSYLQDALAAIRAIREPTEDTMRAVHEAMFVDPWDATSAVMIGAGFEAGIDSILSEEEAKP